MFYNNKTYGLTKIMLTSQNTCILRRMNLSEGGDNPGDATRHLCALLLYFDFNEKIAMSFTTSCVLFKAYLGLNPIILTSHILVLLPSARGVTTYLQDTPISVEHYIL